MNKWKLNQQYRPVDKLDIDLFVIVTNVNQDDVINKHFNTAQ